MMGGLQERLFAFIHGNRLIYNSCWEDPRLDRELLGLTSDSSVVAITSAGCNVLDYLLDGPAAIHAVDVNYRQNAVLSLKLALLHAGDHQALFSLFGDGGDLGYGDIYASLRSSLPGWARAFWDEKIRYFNPKGLRRSFYLRGAAGDFAWAFHHIMLNGNNRRLALALLEAGTLAEQRPATAAWSRTSLTGPSPGSSASPGPWPLSASPAPNSVSLSSAIPAGSGPMSGTNGARSSPASPSGTTTSGGFISPVPIPAIAAPVIWSPKISPP
jgi:S-adenosylmethionine-diacylglycerol 3-amino-3-carboxypropyl transferase